MILRALLLLALGLAAACNDAKAPEPTPTDASEPRLVALAPHLAELVFAAGAGEQLVGVSAYSDFPPPVRELPMVSDAFTVDLEMLALLRPDVVLAWESGTPVRVVDELRARGYRVEVLRTRGLADIAPALERIGEFAAAPDGARTAAQAFSDAIHDLEATHRDRAPITVFYQVSSRPLYTVSGGHFIDDVMTLCGGRNVFAALDDLAPAVSAEAVVARDPEVVLAGASGDDPFTEWDRWPAIRFNRYGNRFTLPPDEMGRATTRIVKGIEATCGALDRARENRAADQAAGP